MPVPAACRAVAEKPAVEGGAIEPGGGHPQLDISRQPVHHSAESDPAVQVITAGVRPVRHGLLEGGGGSEGDQREMIERNEQFFHGDD